MPLSVAQGAAVFSMGLGGVVLGGWLFHVPALESIWPGEPTLVPNGGLILILLGVGLHWMLKGAEVSQGRGWRYRAAQAGALLAGVIGLVTLSEHLFGWNVGIDECLLKDTWAAARHAIPGRLSFPTALSALCLGMGLASLDLPFRRLWPGQVCAVVSMLVGSLALIGYVCELPEFRGELSAHRGTAMSVPAVAGFLVLGTGILCARPDRGLMMVWGSQTPGGVLARWLMLVPPAGLLLTGLVYVVLDRGLPVDHAVRTWALGLSNIFFVTVPIWIAGHALHQAGLEREEAHHALEERVDQRTAELRQANAALEAEIVERRQADNALRASEERYRIVADNTYAMEYWADPDGHFLYVSPSCERITGFTAAQFAADPDLLQQLVYPEDRELLAQYHERCLDKGRAPELVEFRLLRRDKTEIWVAHRCQPVFDANGQYRGRRGSLRDITERKHAEARTREERDFSDALLDSLPGIFYLIDAQGRLVRWNKNLERVTGYSTQEVGQMHARDFFGCGHRRVLAERIQAALVQGDAAWEAELTAKDGTHRPYYFTCLRVALRTAQGLMGVGLDITERKGAEQAVLDRDRELKLVMDAGPTLIAYVDHEARYQRVNLGYCNWYGLSAETVRGRQLQEVMGDAAWAKVEPYVRRALAGEVVSYEEELPWSSGARWIQATYTPDRDDRGVVRGFVVHALDIGERKRAEQALSEGRQLLEAIIDNSTACVYVKDLAGRYCLINRRWGELFHTDRKAVQGKTDYEVFPREQAEAFRAFDRQVLAAGRPLQAEELAPHDDGLHTYISIKCPLYDAAGQPYAICGISTDITERKQAEEALRQAKDRLEKQALELEGRVAERTAKLRETIGDLEAFSYSVAHDMRAPLRGLQGFAQLLLADHADQLDAEARGYLDRIASCASRMDALIQDALNYTQVLRAETPVAPVDLDRLVRHLVATYPNWQPPKVQIRIEGTLPLVLGHEGFLTQSVSNLVGNAVKFVAPGVSPQIRIWAEAVDSHVRLWVKDNGIGIAPKDHERIFRMFERLNHVSQYDGTGIGLAIVHKAVERMGGRVDFISEPGNGSQFWIELKAPQP